MNHLTLDQCKRLKEWGYPQDTWHFYADGELVGAYGKKEQLKDYLEKASETYASPGLEELIGWLGDDFKSVGRSTTLILGNTWSAHSIDDYAGFGHDPLSAVFKLCEAIHANDGK